MHERGDVAFSASLIPYAAGAWGAVDAEVDYFFALAAAYSGEDPDAEVRHHTKEAKNAARRIRDAANASHGSLASLYNCVKELGEGSRGM